MGSASAAWNSHPSPSWIATPQCPEVCPNSGIEEHARRERQRDGVQSRTIFRPRTHRAPSGAGEQNRGGRRQSVRSMFWGGGGLRIPGGGDAPAPRGNRAARRRGRSAGGSARCGGYPAASMPRRATWRTAVSSGATCVPKTWRKKRTSREGDWWSCSPSPVSTSTGPWSVSTSRQHPPTCQRGHQGDIDAQLRMWMGMSFSVFPCPTACCHEQRKPFFRK